MLPWQQVLEPARRRSPVAAWPTGERATLERRHTVLVLVGGCGLGKSLSTTDNYENTMGTVKVLIA